MQLLVQRVIRNFFTDSHFLKLLLFIYLFIYLRQIHHSV